VLFYKRKTYVLGPLSTTSASSGQNTQQGSPYGRVSQVCRALVLDGQGIHATVLQTEHFSIFLSIVVTSRIDYRPQNYHFSQDKFSYFPRGTLKRFM